MSNPIRMKVSGTNVNESGGVWEEEEACYYYIVALMGKQEEYEQVYDQEQDSDHELRLLPDKPFILPVNYIEKYTSSY